MNPAFAPDSPSRPPGLPSVDELLRLYFSTVSWGNANAETDEITWAIVFCAFRLAAICQGIAARLARGQASSEKARQHVAAMNPLAEFAWERVVKLMRRHPDDGGDGDDDDADMKGSTADKAKL